MLYRDRQRLRDSFERLKRFGELEYSGEYGAEITTFIPFVGWLKREGYLSNKRIRTYAGMRAYYYFLDDAEFATKIEKRNWFPLHKRYWPSPSTYSATSRPWHVYPDYRQQFRDSGRSFSRPVLFIQNKFTVEWGCGPMNFIPLNALVNLFENTTDRYDVVYSRPGSFDVSANGYVTDANSELDYPDREILSRFPQVHHLERICAEGHIDYNTTKLEMLAKANLFVAVQGGSAHILACFGNSLLLLFDREGNERLAGKTLHEYPHAYRRGPYKYLSENPPYLVVPRQFPDFVYALDMMRKIDVIDGVLSIPTDARAVLKKWAM